MKTFFSFVFVLSTAGALSAWAQVQQPAATQPRVASKKIPFFSTEILGTKYKSNNVMLEHPSKPASMRRAQYVSPIVQVAGDDIPTKHLFDDTVKGAQPAKAANSVPAAPSDSITPITDESTDAVSEKRLEPIPEPGDSAAKDAPTAVEPVVISEPVVVSNVEDSITVSTGAQPLTRSEAVFVPSNSLADVTADSKPVVSFMGTGCSN